MRNCQPVLTIQSRFMVTPNRAGSQDFQSLELRKHPRVGLLTFAQHSSPWNLAWSTRGSWDGSLKPVSSGRGG